MSDGLEMTEGPFVGTGDSPKLDKGLADGAGLRDGSSDGMFA